MRKRFLPAWDGPPARLVEVVFAVSLLTAVALLLGSFGLLTASALLSSLLVLGAIVWVWSRQSGAPGEEAALPPAPPLRRGATVVASAVAFLTVLHLSGGVHDSLEFGIYRQDSTWYHLPFAATIFQTGDTWALQFTDPMALTAWFYPQNSELLHAVGMLAFGNDFPSPLLNLGWTALALLAAWCIGRPYGRGPEALVLTALVLDAGMMRAQAGNAPNDMAGVCLLLAAIALLVNGWEAGRGRGEGWRPSSAVVFAAALAAGLAVGTKITLVVAVAALTVMLPTLVAAERRLRTTAVWLGGVSLTGGYWYLRNLAHSGNPLPWISPGPLPGPDQLGLYPRPPHSVAEYLDEPGIWVDRFAPALGETLGPLWPLVIGAAVAGLVLGVKRGGLQRGLALMGIAAAVTYALIPVSASGSPGRPSGFESNLRYLAPALITGLVLLPLQRQRAGERAWMRYLLPALVLAFLAGLLTSSGWELEQVPLGLVLGALLVAVPVAAARARVPASRLAGAVGLCLALAVGLGYSAQREYLQGRYLPVLAPPADNPGFRETPQWRRIQGWARNVEDSRIAISGPPAAFGQYVLYGPDLSNRVEYVGEPGPHGSYRPISNCASWRASLNRHRPHFLVVTPASELGPGSVPQESLWTRGDPGAHQILEVAPAAVFRIDRPLDPRGCDNEGLPPVVRVPGGGFAVPGTER
ncbi:MAG TPA: hypothetical protein VFT79_11480 [Solirubrobacterales bacterium]|nr:hypothetical protein [Solirubrobacterales bacterium]